MTVPRAAACVLALGLLLLTAGPVLELHAQSPKPTSVTIMVGGDAVFVEADVDPDLGGVEVVARLHDPQGIFKAEARTVTSPQGSAELRFATQGAGRPRPVHLAPGDSVHVSIAGGDPSTWIASEISAEADSDARAVAGTAPPGANVTVTAVDPARRASARAVADESGRWVADLSGQDLDFSPGTHGQAYYRSGAVTTQVSWAVRGVELRVGADTARVFAPASTEVALSVSGTTTSTWGGYAVAQSANALDGESVWLSDAAGEGASLPADGSASVVIGGTRDDIQLPAISLDPDPGADTVAGTARPGTELRVTAGGGIRDVVAGPDGRWSADFAGVVDIDHDTEATASTTIKSVSGLVWRVSRTAWVPGVLGADPVFAAVDVRGQAGDAVKVAAAYSGPEMRRVVTGTLGADGTARIWVLEENREVVRMDRVDALAVEMAGLIFPFAVWHPALDASAADDTVEGQAPPGTRIEVRAGETVRLTTAGEDGRWSTDLAGGTDLVPGSRVSVQASGTVLTTTLTFPVLRVNAQVGTTYVRIEGPPGGGLITMELERDGEVIADGGCVAASGGCATHLESASGMAEAMRGGDTLLVFVGGSTEILDIVRVSTHIDPSGRDVVGLAPPSATLFVDFENPQGGPAPPSATTWSDTAGVFDHELPAVQWPLLGPGVVSDVYFTLAGGHRVFSRGVLERAEVSDADRAVRGQAEPSAAVTVTVRAGGAEWVGWDIASGLGEYAMTVPPGYLGVGATVRVEHNRGAHQAQIEGLAAWALPPGEHDGIFIGRDLAATGGGPESVPVDFVYRRAAPHSPLLLPTTSSHGGGLHAGGPQTGRSAILHSEVRAWLPGAIELVAPLDLDRTNRTVNLPSVRSAR